MKEIKPLPPLRFLIGLNPYKNKVLLSFLAFLLLFLVFFLFLQKLQIKNIEKIKIYESDQVNSPPHIACPYESPYYDFNAKNSTSAIRAKAVVIPHHLLAGRLINENLSQIDPNFATIILVGPNHSGIGQSPVQSSTLVWKTKFGNISPDEKLINQFKNENQVTVSGDYFDLEHSVCGLVTFLKKYFPRAKIVPLIVRNDVSHTTLKTISSRLKRNCDNCLVVASVDFSHDVPESKAIENDASSIKILRENKLENFDGIVSDCNQCLKFIHDFLDEKEDFFLKENNNSFQISGVDSQSVTSYVSAYFSNNLINLAFTGDLMFDRHIRQTAQNKGYDFILEGLHDYLIKKDLVLSNLEGPITDYESISVNTQPEDKNHYLLTFDPKLADSLVNNNIKLVNIGNNHILNFGSEGLNQTKQYLRNVEIYFFGNTGSESDFQRYIIVEKKGVKIGFVNYNQFINNSLELALEDLKRAKEQSDVVVLYAHWGIEYAPLANQNIQNLARKFIESGADIVIGSHPHVVQQKELYQDKPIYYSLGNFVFDQYFSEATKKGLIVEMVIEPATLEKNYLENKVLMEEAGKSRLEN